MFRQYLSVPPDFFSAFRELPTRSVRNFNREVREVVEPNIQKQVDGLFTEPGPVKYKFEFGTARSRRWYFANFKDRLPYQRTGTLVKAWSVEITRQGQTTFIMLVNTAPEAKYVYGLPPIQRQIPGHARTGWGRDNKVAFQIIQEYTIDQLIDAWYRATTDAVKGKD